MCESVSSYVPAFSGAVEADVGVRVGEGFEAGVFVVANKVPKLIGVFVKPRGVGVAVGTKVDVDVRVGNGAPTVSVDFCVPGMMMTGLSVRSSPLTWVDDELPPDETPLCAVIENPLRGVSTTDVSGVDPEPPGSSVSSEKPSSTGDGIAEEIPGSVPMKR